MLCPPAQAISSAPLGGLLPSNVLEVDQVRLAITQQDIAIHLEGDYAIARIDEVDHIHQGLHRIDINAADHGGLAGIHLRNHETFEFLPTGFDRDGQRPSKPRVSP